MATIISYTRAELMYLLLAGQLGLWLGGFLFGRRGNEGGGGGFIELAFKKGCIWDYHPRPINQLTIFLILFSFGLGSNAEHPLTMIPKPPSSFFFFPGIRNGGGGLKGHTYICTYCRTKSLKGLSSI